jgi:hypothetical protein
MTEIKDLAGLSEPMKKLIEVVEKGVGQLFKPWQIKRIATAKAYEIEHVARALEKHSDTLNLLEYDDEKVKLLCERQGIPPEAAQELIAVKERAANRLVHREMRRQLNIEKAVHYAMDELLQEETVSAEPVDEDWIARFFNIVEDVSNEQMQQLWGRILAGEIKRPKTYSLRTLEILKNISPEEAKVFRKVGKYALSLDKDIFVLQDREWLGDGKLININDMILLQDIGLLIFSIDIEKCIDASKNEVRILYGQLTITIRKESSNKKIRLQIFPFTKSGRELFSLVVHEPSKEDIDYIVNKIKENDHRNIITIS